MGLLQEYAGLQQLRPDEGLMAIELTFITLFDNAMNTLLVLQGKDVYDQVCKMEIDRHMNALRRLSSRVQAWPARPLDAKSRM